VDKEISFEVPVSRVAPPGPVVGKSVWQLRDGNGRPLQSGAADIIKTEYGYITHFDEPLQCDNNVTLHQTATYYG
jgi:hypothetical protein